MIATDLAYLAIAILGLGALSSVLVVIGRAAAACPQTAPAAYLGTWVVTTGFVALGIGVVALVGALLPVLARSQFDVLYAAVSVCFLALGLGFFLAASMLRDILSAAREAAQPPA